MIKTQASYPAEKIKPDYVYKVRTFLVTSYIKFDWLDSSYIKV